MQDDDSASNTRARRSDYQPRILRSCEVCAASFAAKPGNVLLGKARFCSLACFYAMRRTGDTVPCEVCGAPVYAKGSRRAKGGGRFCSVTCHDVAQREWQPVEERLWLRVNKQGSVPPHRAQYGACWNWVGKLNRSGYGVIYRHFPTHVLTHRLAWTLATGDVLKPQDIIGHICDVRDCLRNDDVGTYTVRGRTLPRAGHLFKGTHRDNMDDMVAKGRQRSATPRGEASPHAKLTNDDIQVIRYLYAHRGLSQQTICDIFGVTQSLISQICLRQAWRHIE